jgi:PEP-CTERM motif
VNSNDNLLFPIGMTFAGPPVETSTKQYVSVSNLDNHGVAFITAAGIFDIFGFDQPNTTPAPSPTGNNYGESPPAGFGGVGHFDVTATPLPAALPLLAGGLGIIGLLARRKKRQARGTVGAA